MFEESYQDRAQIWSIDQIVLETIDLEKATQQSITSKK